MKSIRTKLIVYFSAIVFIVCAIFMAVSTNNISKAVTSEVEKSLAIKADDSAQIISSRNEQNFIYLEGIAARNSISSSAVSIDEKMTVLLDEVANSDRFIRIGVSDLAGNLYLSDSYGLKGSVVDISARDYLHVSANGDRGIMNPVISVNPDDNGALIMAYSVPIYENGQITGVLVAVANAWFLSDMTDDMVFGDTGYTYIIDSTGTVISHPERELVENAFNPITAAESDASFTSLSETVSSALQEGTGTINYQYNGTDLYTSFAPVEGMDWIVMVEVQQDEILSAVPALIRTNIIISILILLVSIIVCYLIARQLSTPIISANKMIKEIKLGHLSHRMKVTSRDEVGQMSQSLNELADDLQNKVVDLMQKISQGDVTATLDVADEQDEITPALKHTVETIRSLIGESTALVAAAKNGEWEKRGNADSFSGGFKEIVQGFNDTLDTVVDQMFWYEAILDSVPFPIHVTDNDMKWTFMNAAFEDTMIRNNVIKNRQSGYGMDCYNANADICQTEGCGIRRLVDQGLTDSYFEWDGRYNKQDTAYLKDKNGNNVGFVETVTDLTPMISVSNYTNAEVARLATNLQGLSQGNLDFDLALGESNEFTQEVSAQFAEIRNSLSDVKESMDRLINDATMLADAGIAGQLESRADATLHQGDFAKVVAGLNGIMDAVSAPIQEASETLNELSRGNLNTGMTGDYNGAYVQIKDDMNNTVTFLKHYVDEITTTLTEIGQGNLDLEITDDYLGDFQAIKESLNRITAELSKTLSDIGDASGQVEAGANQISDGGQALSQGATEQAAAIEQLNASMDEVASDTGRNATNANRANELTGDVKSSAETGNAQMNEMVSAMADINASSQNISKIIKVIDDIAFQTNILALNAAVEAARAGQHGKGFAVVAEEVRTLAARSADAARETTELIEGSISKVEIGTTIANNTAESLEEIQSKIETMTGLVNEIATASNMQATKINEINQGIEQVSKVVQTNSATAEESAAASEELSGQAELLQNKVNAFKLKKASGSFTAKVPKAKPAQPVAESFQATEPTIMLDDFEADSFDKY
ncbi:methyl-accepting chemotaxis protein [Eubacteriaceae bacterium ES2]|nr:methyl-accepting chemotaxis protein [Eubacteriaceae bacterium ES2]